MEDTALAFSGNSTSRVPAQRKAVHCRIELSQRNYIIALERLAKDRLPTHDSLSNIKEKGKVHATEDDKEFIMDSEVDDDDSGLS